jgi:hypothetical protein
VSRRPPVSRDSYAAPLVLAEQAVALDRAAWLRATLEQAPGGAIRVALYRASGAAPDDAGALLFRVGPLVAIDLASALWKVARRAGQR